MCSLENVWQISGLKESADKRNGTTLKNVPFEPLDYKRLLQVPEYRKSYNSVLKETLAGDVLAGAKVEIDLLNVPPLPPIHCASPNFNVLSLTDTSTNKL